MNPPSEVPPCSEQRSETTCAEMFRDFPNSLENSRICRKVKEEGEKVDWISKHLAECDRSSDFFARFISSHSHSPASPTHPGSCQPVLLAHVKLLFFSRFMSSSCCGKLWCKFAAPLVGRWRSEESSLKCKRDSVVESSSSSRRARLRCRTVRNSLKAVKFLNCNVYQDVKH